MILEFLTFSDEMNFIIILIVLLILAIVIGLLFELKSLLAILVLFSIICVYLYMNEALTMEYAAIGYLVFAIVVYGVLKLKETENI